MIRYFQRIDVQGNPLVLFRLDADDKKQTLLEQRWNMDTSGWEATDRLVGYLVDGSVFVEQVDERTAMRSFPDAFVSRIAKNMTPTVIVKHLAGKHDQAAHGHGGGRASTLNPDNQFSSPFTARVTDEGFEVDEEGMVEFLEGQKSAHSQVTKAEGEAVIAYQSTMYYEQINGGLREQSIMGETDILDAETRGIIDKVDHAIDKSGFDEDIVVFRGIDDADGFISELKTGEGFSDPAFQSTTLNPIVASSFAMGSDFSGNPVVLRIKVPAKSPALAADVAGNRALGQKVQPHAEDASMLGFSIAAEVILPRHTMYEVTGTSKVDGVTLLDVTVVRND
jgi:hypothetical protein